jgi:hypothetical protein
VAVLWYPKMTIGCVSLPVKLMWAEAQTPAKLETTNPQAPPNPKRKWEKGNKREGKPEEREESPQLSQSPSFICKLARPIRFELRTGIGNWKLETLTSQVKYNSFEEG